MVERGTYVRPATNSALDPITIAGQTRPSLFGARVIALEATPSPAIVNVQAADGGSGVTQWLDNSTVGLELEGVDVAADGTRRRSDSRPTSAARRRVRRIAVLAIQGVDQMPAVPAAVDCVLPATRIARDASLAQDGSAIAWTDDAGVKVAGSPSTAANPWVMGSTPRVLSPTGAHPSIGGADVAAFLPRPPAIRPAPPAAPGPVVPGGVAPRAMVVTLPAKVTTRALAAPRGVKVKVGVSGPGKVSIRGTVPARRLGRRGKPLVVATREASRARRRHADDPAATHPARPQARPPPRGRASRPLRIVQGSREARKAVRLR